MSLKLLLLIPILLVAAFVFVGECIRLSFILFVQIGNVIWGRDAHKQSSAVEHRVELKNRGSMPREITVGEFTAEELEREAAAMPPSYKAQADVLRDAAKIYRERGSKKKIRVWEEGEPGYPGSR